MSTERHTYRMWEHKGWGDTMFWLEVPDFQGKGRIHGHLHRRPQPGDRIIEAMRSGRNAIFEVQAEGAKYFADPPDQYFVNVVFVGYEDEPTQVKPRIGSQA